MEDTFDFPIEYDSISNVSQIMSPLGTHDFQDEDLFEEIIQGSRKIFRCTFSDCGKTFKFRSEIVRHVLIHQKDRPYSCTYPGCKKNFKRADALENHMRLHTGTLPYLCTVPGCEKKYATKAALRYHQIRHNNTRDFKCDYKGCSKSFLTCSQLKQHQKAHNYRRECYDSKIRKEQSVKIIQEVVDNQDKYCEEEVLQGEQTDETGRIQWEIMNQHDEEEGTAEKKFEIMIKYILDENRILKEKIRECEKCPGYVEKEEKYDFISYKQPQVTPINETISFFDNDQIKFLEFLRGRDNNEF